MSDGGAPSRVVTTSEAEAMVVEMLSRGGSMTTMEIEKAAASVGLRCPDQTVLFLTKMKSKGMIKGEVSRERRGWLWSLP